MRGDDERTGGRPFREYLVKARLKRGTLKSYFDCDVTVT